MLLMRMFTPCRNKKEIVHVAMSMSVSFTSNKVGYLMMFTQYSILYCHSPKKDENRGPFVRQRTDGIELHLVLLSAAYNIYPFRIKRKSRTLLLGQDIPV